MNRIYRFNINNIGKRCIVHEYDGKVIVDVIEK